MTLMNIRELADYYDISQSVIRKYELLPNFPKPYMGIMHNRQYELELVNNWLTEWNKYKAQRAKEHCTNMARMKWKNNVKASA